MFFDILRGIIKWCIPYGIIMRRREKYMGEYGDGYEQIFPGATYAPWVTDDIFLSVYDAIKDNTLVDKYRCYELWQLVKENSKLESGGV